MNQASTTKETREFQAETRQLLELMVHSIYTNREIFLRELISNASDALDKIRFASLTNQDLLEGDADFFIEIEPNETNHTLTIKDNGMGMTYDEVVENLGTIAKSGTKAFLEKMKESGAAADQDLIGQFGVGFYSAFMVAQKVTVLTRAPGQEQGVKWESAGDGTYTIEACDKANRGTTIILTLNEEHRNPERPGENFLNRYVLENLVKKYSDYIRYPIKMGFIKEEKPRDDEGKIIEDAPATQVLEVRTLNSQTPLWTRNKNEIKQDEYHQLYKNLFVDWVDPLEVIHSKVEGAVEYTALLFIPARAPLDFHRSREHDAGIRLYSKNIFIMDKCKDLLPEYLRFVRGLVDSPDFSLNISRELLQHDKQLKLIGKNLEKSVIKTLENMMAKDRPKYEKFWREFGTDIKGGIYVDYQNREKLQNLLLFPSSKSEELTTLEDYVNRMPEKQKVIYYATGKDYASVERLPQLELLREKGLEVLYLFDRVDEFALDALQEYKGKKFQSVSRGDLNLDDLDTADTHKNTEEIAKENEALIKAVKEQLSGKISDVKISSRLKSSAVCLVSDDQGISLSMEQILAEVNKSLYKANRILEINPHHAVFASLKQLHETAPASEAFKDYCALLYDQALLIEGLVPEDPIGFANKVAELMARQVEAK